MTAGIIGDNPEGLPEGATLQMSFYYRDASNNMVTVAATTITNSTNTFPGQTRTSWISPCRRRWCPAANAWAGKNIGIEFLVTVGFDKIGGDWDVDNVRLSESSAARRCP